MVEGQPAEGRGPDGRRPDAAVRAGRGERAKLDGRWDAAYDSVATASVPDDLRSALTAAGLTDAFEKLDRRNRYAILHRVQTAKRPDTRAKRIAKYVGMLAAGETPY